MEFCVLQFVLIINEKKAKIRGLKEELSNALSGAGTTQSKVVLMFGSVLLGV